MMNLLTPLLVVLLAIPVPHSIDTDKDKKKGKDQYYKYEREDVSVFREKVDFVLPDPVPVQYATEEQGEMIDPIDLSPRFSQGQRVIVEASPTLNALVARDKYLKRQIETLPGYRIHIYAGTNRQQAWNAKRKALGAFPETVSYLDYTVPNYVVRLGDFIDRDDAYIFLRETRRFFPGAFLVTADVKVPKPSDYDNSRD